MKTIKSLALALLVIAGTAVSQAQNKKINVEKSNITWVGKKVTGEHTGTVKFKEGILVFQKGALKGGNFTVDMTTIGATDLTGDWKQKLDGHLKADDFFGTAKFPTATLVFKKIGSKGNGVYTVTADLTIKGITKPVTFDITVNGNTATSNFKIDRTKYDIKYGSGSFFSDLGDKTINDDFEVSVKLEF
jgi:polyisoprenoid-binding protein YceI